MGRVCMAACISYYIDSRDDSFIRPLILLVIYEDLYFEYDYIKFLENKV